MVQSTRNAEQHKVTLPEHRQDGVLPAYRADPKRQAVTGRREDTRTSSRSARASGSRSSADPDGSFSERSSHIPVLAQTSNTRSARGDPTAWLRRERLPPFRKEGGVPLAFTTVNRRSTWPITRQSAAASSESTVSSMGAPGRRTVNRADYAAYIRSPEWAAVRRKYWASKMPKACYICGGTDRPMDLHHRTYKNLGRERLMDLVPVHPGCHKRIHEVHGKRTNQRQGLWKSTKVAHRQQA